MRIECWHHLSVLLCLQLQVNGHDVTHENEKLKDQVITLNTQLQEVIDMNTRWQSYNKQKEEYLQTLQQKIKDMEDTAANDKPLQLSEQQQLEIDRIILQYKQKVEVTEEEKVKVSSRLFTVWEIQTQSSSN